MHVGVCLSLSATSVAVCLYSILVPIIIGDRMYN